MRTLCTGFVWTRLSLLDKNIGTSARLSLQITYQKCYVFSWQGTLRHCDEGLWKRSNRQSFLALFSLCNMNLFSNTEFHPNESIWRDICKTELVNVKLMTGSAKESHYIIYKAGNERSIKWCKGKLYMACVCVFYSEDSVQRSGDRCRPSPFVLQWRGSRSSRRTGPEFHRCEEANYWCREWCQTSVNCYRHCQQVLHTIIQFNSFNTTEDNGACKFYCWICLDHTETIIAYCRLCSSSWSHFLLSKELYICTYTGLSEDGKIYE